MFFFPVKYNKSLIKTVVLCIVYRCNIKQKMLCLKIQINMILERTEFRTVIFYFIVEFNEVVQSLNKEERCLNNLPWIL